MAVDLGTAQQPGSSSPDGRRRPTLKLPSPRLTWSGAVVAAVLAGFFLPAAGLASLVLLVGVGALSGGRTLAAVAGVQAFALLAVSPRFTFGPYAITPAMVLGLGCLFLWVVGMVVRTRSSLAPTRSPMALATLGFVWVMLLSYASGMTRALLAVERTASFRALLLLAAGVGVTLLISDGVKSERSLRRLLGAFLGGAFCLSLVAILQFTVDVDLTTELRPPGFAYSGPGPAAEAERLGLGRVAGTTGHPIEAGAVAAIAMPIALHFAWFGATRKARSASFVVALMLLATMMMSVSRTALLGLLVGLVIMLPRWSPQRRFKFSMAAVSVFVFGSLLMPQLFDAVITIAQDWRGEEIENVGVEGRLEDYGFVRAAVIERPLLGLGYGTYTTQRYFALDNQYANSLVETGLLGLFALLGIIAMGWSLARRTAKRVRDPALADLGVAVAASIAVAAVANATYDALGFHVSTGVFFLMLGVAGALYRVAMPAREPLIPPREPRVRRRPAFDPDAPATTDRTEQVVMGTRWGVLTQIVTQVSRLAVSLVLARLLAPQDYGIVIFGLTVVQLLDIFKDLGTASAVIQRQVISQRLLSSLFYVNVSVGILLSLLLCLAAPFLARTAGEPGSANLLRAMSLTLVISAFGMVQQGLVRRLFLFRRLTVMTISQAIVSGVVSIVAAKMGYGAWSLVYGQLAGVFVAVATSWWSTGWRPSFHFDVREVRSVAGFSLNLAGFNLLAFLFLNADKVLVGRYLGAAALGYYGLGQRVLMYPVRSVTQMLQQVLFPTFARVQDDNATMRRGYLRAAAGIAMVTFPLMAGFTVVADPFVRGVLSERWAPAIPIMTILAPVGLLHSLHFTVGAIYSAKGRSDLLLKWGMISGSLTLVAYIIGLQWGVNGVAVSYAVAVALLTYPAFAMPFKLIDLPVRELAKAVAPYTLATAVMAGLALGTRLAMEAAGFGVLPTLAASVTVGALSYGGWVLKAKPPALRELLHMVRGRRARAAAGPQAAAASDAAVSAEMSADVVVGGDIPIEVTPVAAAAGTHSPAKPGARKRNGRRGRQRRRRFTVAAVIPTYQRRELALRAVESVRRQSYPPDEIIVVDDGSDDGTAEAFAGQADVRVIRQPNLGAAAARNSGWRAATSDWVAFLDSDDVWRPHHLSTMVRAIEATDGAANVYFADLVRDEGVRQFEWAEFDVEAPWQLEADASAWVCLPHQPMMLQSSVIKRSALEEVGGIWEELPTREDTHLFLVLGLGRPNCAVAHVGVDMTADAASRIGVRQADRHVSYWRHTEQLYADVLSRRRGNAAARRVLRHRLVGARLRLAGRERRPGMVWAAFRTDPLDVARRLVDRKART